MYSIITVQNFIQFCFCSFLFRSGHEQHKDDKFRNTVIEVQKAEAPDGEYVKVGEFDGDGIASGTVPDEIGRLKRMRLRVLGNLDNWVIITEVSFKYLKFTMY